jgi:hypothetical protein
MEEKKTHKKRHGSELIHGFAFLLSKYLEIEIEIPDFPER